MSSDSFSSIDIAALTSLIEQCFNRALEKKFNESLTYPSDRRNKFKNCNNDRTSTDLKWYEDELKAYDSFYYDGSSEFESSDDESIFYCPENFRTMLPSQKQKKNTDFHSKQSINEWDTKPKFSGLNVGQTPKENSVNHFLRRTRTYMQTNHIQPSEFFQNISQYLYGPALNWYSISKHFICSFNSFEQAILNRFAKAITVNEDVIDISNLFVESNECQSDIQRLSTKCREDELNVLCDTVNNGNGNMLQSIYQNLYVIHDIIVIELNRLIKCNTIKIRSFAFPFTNIQSMSSIHSRNLISAFDFNAKNLIRQNKNGLSFNNFKCLLHMYGIEIQYSGFTHSPQNLYETSKQIMRRPLVKSKSNRSTFMARYGRSINTNGANDSQNEKKKKSYPSFQLVKD